MIHVAVLPFRRVLSTFRDGRHGQVNYYADRHTPTEAPLLETAIRALRRIGVSELNCDNSPTIGNANRVFD